MAKVIITEIEVDEFVKTLLDGLRPVLKEEFKKEFSKEFHEKLSTATETCKLLGITKPTLSSWAKQGIITEYRLGGRIYFKHSEIISSLQSLKKYKRPATN